MAQYLMQARDSVTGEMVRWVSSGTPDFSGGGYPGPNSAEEIAVVASPGDVMGIDLGALLAPLVVTVAGTAHTLEGSDANKELRTTNVSDTIITVPPQSSVAWPENARVPMLRLPAGRLTIAPGAGVTITTKTGFEPSTLGPVGAVMLERVGEDQWVLYGDLEEST